MRARWWRRRSRSGLVGVVLLGAVAVGCAGCSGADGGAPDRPGPPGPSASGVAAAFEIPPIAPERADIERVARRATEVRYNIDRPRALPPDSSQDVATQIERTLAARAAGYQPSVHAAISEVYEPSGPDAAVLKEAVDRVVATPQPSSVPLGGEVRDWRTTSVDVGAGTATLEAGYSIRL